MKCIGISDLHGHLPDLSLYPTDTLIIAGDIVPATRDYNGFLAEGRLKQGAWIYSKFIPWLESIPATHIVMTWGNHDHCGEGDTIPDVWWPDHCHMLTNRYVELDGVGFYGVPQTPRFYDWAFNEDDHEEALGRYWRKVHPYTDVLVSHGPPYGAVDRVGTRNVGSVTQRRWLESDAANRPTAVVCGHIHTPGGQQTTIGDIRIFNVAAVDERYLLVDRRPTHFTVTDIKPKG